MVFFILVLKIFNYFGIKKYNMDLSNSIHFLKELAKNNNREWFNKNKDSYKKAREQFLEFTQFLIQKINEFDREVGIHDPKNCIFRIYRDIRFSKNKAPYKTNFAAFISKGGRKGKYAGYYFHLEPGGSFFGGGIYRPDPQVLKSVRSEICFNYKEFQTIIKDAGYRKYFREIQGERLKLAPKGFPKDFEGIELLKLKDFFVSYQVDDQLLKDKKNFDEIIEVFKKAKPLNHFLNQAVDLTGNAGR